MQEGVEVSVGPAIVPDTESPHGGTTATHLSASMIGGVETQQPNAAAQGGALAHDPHDRNRSVSSAPRGSPPVHPGSLNAQEQQQQLQLQQQQQFQQQHQPGQHLNMQQQMPPLSAASLSGLSRFTAGFPPGPQQNLIAQLPWFAQLRNAQLQSAAGMGGGSLGGGLSAGGGAGVGLMGGNSLPGGDGGYAAAMAAAAGGPRFRSSSFPADAQARMASLSSLSAASARPKVPLRKAFSKSRPSPLV